MMTFSRRKLVFLALLGFAMSIGSMTIDWQDFAETPWFLWPFVPICPLYPFLLGVLYAWRARKGKWPVRLMLFTLLGITSYGVIAIVFYPLYMLENGFAWYELGNVFWVMIYSLQAVWLWKEFGRDGGHWRPGRLSKVSTCLIAAYAVYFFAKDILDRYSVTFSYVRYNILSDVLTNRMFITVLVVHTLVFLTYFLTMRRERIS